VLWLAAIVVLAAVVLLATEWWVRHRAVQEAADRIATAIEADVELHVVGRPLAWRLLRRHLHQVILVADDLPVLEGRARLRRLRIELDNVRLEGPAEDRRITAAAGRFDLRLDGDQLLPMVTLPPFLMTFSIIPRGLRLMTLAGVTVDASLELAGSALKVRANRGVLRLIPHPTFWLPLPTWPYGAVVDDMLLHDGWLEAWGTLDPDKLVFPVTALGDAPRPTRSTMPDGR
jgi:hypothetical protein